MKLEERIRPYVLPFAIVAGFVLHKPCHLVGGIMPFLIFTILFFNYSAVDVRKIRFSMLDVWLMLFQIVVSLGSYLLLKLCGASEIVAQGVLGGVICPVAAAAVVVSCMLGADRETVTAYTIVGNLMVAVVAPIYFSFIGINQDMPFLESFWMILKKLFPVIVLPFLAILLLQSISPKAAGSVRRYKGMSFYLWGVAFTITMGQTIDYIFLHGEGNLSSIVMIGIASIVYCVIQFASGRWLGGKYGDRIAGGQLLGQKNSAFGIWMTNMYLVPLASVFPALYSIWQNLFNSYQIWRHDRKIPGRVLKLFRKSDRGNYVE